MVAVTYRRSFTGGSKYKALNGKIWSFGLAVAHGGSTVLGLLEYEPPSPDESQERIVYTPLGCTGSLF